MDVEAFPSPEEEGLFCCSEGGVGSHDCGLAGETHEQRLHRFFSRGAPSPLTLKIVSDTLAI